MARWTSRSAPRMRYACAHDATHRPTTPQLAASARDWAALAARHPATGAASSASSEIGIAGHRSRRREEARLLDWLAAGRHGEMDYMARHGAARARPADARARARCASSRARMNYWPGRARARRATVLGDSDARRTSRATRSAATTTRCCARRLAAARRRASRDEVGDFGYRVFTDSAPVLEVALAREVGPRLARQAHAAAHARRGLVVLPRRDLHRPAAAGHARRRARIAARCTRVHRRLSDRRDRRAVRARRAALHLVPHDRARRQHSRRRCGR